MAKTANKTSKKRSAFAHAELRAADNGARKKSPVTVTLRTKGGRVVIASPAKSATTLASWSQAFGSK
jgi:hypothetical protein